MEVSMEWLIEVLLSDSFLKVVLFFFTMGLAVSVVAHAQKNRVFGRTIKKINITVQSFFQYANEATEKRIREEERLQKEQGNREKKNVFYRMDEVLLRTGIRDKVPFLTVELLILLGSMFFLFVLMVITKWTGSFILGIAVSILLYILALEIVKLLLRRRRKKVEDNILQFANLLENYSRTSDDIVSIFHKIAIYLEEPLRSAIEKCYIETIATGDFAVACNHLDIRIGNRHFSDLLANIEICSRHRANYEEVIRGNKEIIRKYLSERDVRAELARNARIEITVILLIGIIMLPLINDIMSGALFQILIGSIFGNFLLTGMVVILLYCIHIMVTIGGDEEA